MFIWEWFTTEQTARAEAALKKLKEENLVSSWETGAVYFILLIQERNRDRNLKDDSPR